MGTFLIWLVVGIGIAGLAASIWISEHGGPVETPAPTTEDVLPPLEA